jgi:hypothetical protein
MRDASGVTTETPLTTLLSWAWIAFAIEADNAVEAAGSDRVGRLFRISLPMWANGLRFIDGDGITVDELRARARAACNVPGLERWGWITLGEPGPKRRPGFGTQRGVKGDTVLRPTRAGAYARRLWPRAVAGVEQRWEARFGANVIAALREALLPFTGSMPWSPPEVHPSDGFFTPVIEGPAETVPPDGPPGENVPFAGLLGQVLTALTFEHEQDAEVSLPLGANILRVIGDKTVPVRDLPRLSGVSKEAIAMGTGFLARHMLADLPERSVTLTAPGLDALDGYRVRAARTADGTVRAARRDDQALRSALEAIVSQREALAEGLRPPEGGWRAEKPYLAQTQRVLADPPAALPWHPMVLHRGAWPDGS